MWSSAIPAFARMLFSNTLEVALVEVFLGVGRLVVILERDLGLVGLGLGWVLTQFVLCTIGP